MLRFKNGLLQTTTMSAVGAVGDPNAAAGGGGAAGDFLSSLPEPLRANEAFKDVKDVGTLAQRYLDSTKQKPFAEILPADIKGDASFKDIKDLDGLARSYINQAKMIGIPKDRVLAVPGNDDEKDWAQVYDKLGRPAAPDKYEIPKLADGKDYSDDDKAMQTALLPILHTAGLSQRQVAAIVPKWNEFVGTLRAADETRIAGEIAEADKALKTEWGAAAGEKIALAQSAINHFADTLKLGDGIKQALQRKGPDGKMIGNDPAFAKLFAHLGAQMKEDGLIGKGDAGGKGGDAYSPTEAEQQINALQADKAFMADYMNKKAPGHAEAVAKMQRLYEMKAPPKQAAE